MKNMTKARERENGQCVSLGEYPQMGSRTVSGEGWGWKNRQKKMEEVLYIRSGRFVEHRQSSRVVRWSC